MSPREALTAYTLSGGAAFYFLANGDAVVGVRSGRVSTLTFNDYRETGRLGPVAGSRAELMNGPQGVVAVITFADGARYYSSIIIPSTVPDAREEVAEYNRLAGYVPGPVGYVPAERPPAPHDPPARHDPPAQVWSCRFCRTRNVDRARCDHCGAPRP